MQMGDIETLEVAPIFSNLLNDQVISIEEIGGGRNSRVYKIICENTDHYTAKLYFRHGSDARDRLGVEFSSLQFLWKNGMRSVPQPIIADKKHNCAIYEYIDGQEISSLAVTDADLDQAIQFLATLYKLRTRSDSFNLPPASEACFSIQAIVDNITLRLNRLSDVDSKGEQYEALHKFLTEEIGPSFDEIINWCKSKLRLSGMSFEAELSAETRTLSPSDFGFHNVLRRSDDRIIFLDFEYFGWDDPAKMITDFLHHPAMTLPETLKEQFVIKMLARFRDNEYLAKRVEIVYPLFGLKWCMIILNEFVPEYLRRRGFAGRMNLDRSEVQMKQLAKAKRMLHRIRNEYERFPYST